tara:strand:- start:267 stop:521 length:255 start_codon:yes stop_codon:yes gene_type:complete
MTKTEKVLTALKSGETLTAKQITSRFGFTSTGAARKTVSNLRMQGYAIHLNETVDTKGRVKNKYRLGTPTRAVVAAGYRALAAA